MLVLPPGGRPKEEPAAAADDHALLTRVRAGDQSVSAAFYDRARPIVDRTLSRLLGVNDTDYEDAAQDTLFELVQGIDRFRRECPLSAWISIVAARKAFQLIRRRRIERRLFDADPEVDAALSPTATQTRTVAARQAVQCVHRELEAMDPTRSWTFLLHDAYGYDLKEIAQITGASLAAAQSRLVRGRREIHERIRNNLTLGAFFRHPVDEW
jgi:RNA polymerase sigma-70 factor (ECF subfamily)